MISRKIAKRIKVAGLASMIMFTGMASSAIADVKVEKKNESKVEYKLDENSDLETCVIKWEKLTLENLLGDMIKEVSKEDKAKLENLIQKINKLEEAEKYEEGDKVWKEVDNILNKYYDKMAKEYKPLSFKEFMEGWGEDIKKEDLAKMEKFYNAATKLETEDKYEEAEKQWNQFYEIMDKYVIFEGAVDGNFEGQIEVCTTGMNIEDMKLEDFLGDIKKDMNKEDLAQASKLFDSIKKLEKDENFEESNKVWEKFYNIVDKYYDNMKVEDMSLEDFLGDIKKDLTKEESTKIEKLFEDVKGLEKAEKFEEAKKVWDEIYSIMDKYFIDAKFDGDSMSIDNGMMFEEMKFEDYIADIKEDVKKEDLAKMEKLYNAAVKFEKDAKYEEADKQWMALYEIMDKYIVDTYDTEMNATEEGMK